MDTDGWLWTRQTLPALLAGALLTCSTLLAAGGPAPARHSAAVPAIGTSSHGRPPLMHRRESQRAALPATERGQRSRPRSVEREHGGHPLAPAHTGDRGRRCHASAPTLSHLAVTPAPGHTPARPVAAADDLLAMDDVTLTAYALSKRSTGKRPGDPGFGITASGHRARVGVTIAVDPRVIPLGSWVYIEGVGWRRAEDTGGLVKGRHIDILLPSDDAALAFGVRKHVRVYVRPSRDTAAPHHSRDEAAAHSGEPLPPFQPLSVRGNGAPVYHGTSAPARTRETSRR